jgi:hypothetical protein
MLAIKEEAVISMKPAMYHIHQSGLGKFEPPRAPSHAMTYADASSWVSRQSQGYQGIYTILPVSN